MFSSGANNKQNTMIPAINHPTSLPWKICESLSFGSNCGKTVFEIEEPSLTREPSAPTSKLVSQNVMLILSEETPLDTAAGLAKVSLMFMSFGLMLTIL